MENYPQEEDPGSCLAKTLMTMAVVILAFMGVALLAFFLLSVHRLLLG